MAACLCASAETKEQPDAWGPETQGCRFSATSDRASYRFDQSIRLCLTLKNENNELAVVRQSHVFLAYRFDVRLPNGTPAPLTLEGKRQMDASSAGGSMFGITLKRGQSHIDEVPMLNRLYDMTMIGEYTVTVRRQVSIPRVLKPGEERKPAVPFDVVSNTLKIVVHDQDVKKSNQQKP